MKKLLISMLLLACTSVLYAQEYPYNKYNQTKRTVFRELPVTSKDIILLGNSITDWSEWAEIFNNRNVKNRGIAADRAEWLFDRVDYLIAGKPDKLFLMIGINDLNGGRSPEAVVKDITRLVDMFREGSPRTKIYVQSILPQNVNFRPNAREIEPKVIRVNEALKKMCADRGITYVDLFSLLSDTEGQLNAEYTNDGLHLTGKGYMVWADAIRDYVNKK